MRNIYRVFFIFDKGNIVVLFNGFQKKSKNTLRREFEKALRIKNEYYEYKREYDS
ncbi:MAG: type II toxin-antitoxin system RelE/ParE family toxin [Bacteroidales bacterium]|nr:type II toxin-antitoxin system RelE/ParE family toxin [Bacteroidales bacterium]